MKQTNPYTPTQRKALHLWCENVAVALNDAGYDIKKVMEVRTMDIPWTKTSVKELLYKTTLAAMTGKDSTEAMTTVETSEVCEVLHRHLAEKFGINVPWPSNEPPMIREEL